MKVDAPNGIVLDIAAIRAQFPILNQRVNGHPLVYFDNAATTQKPKAVIQALTDYYSGYNANIHRGIHALAEKATKAFEETTFPSSTLSPLSIIRASYILILYCKKPALKPNPNRNFFVSSK